MAASAAMSPAVRGRSRDGVLAAILRPPLYWLFHSWRLFGWFFALMPLAAFRPGKTLFAMIGYIFIHRRQWWQRAVHRVLGYGASRRHRVHDETEGKIDPDKRYLWSLHPHGVLADGWHSVIARNLNSFDEEGNGPPKIGRKIALCFAPIIQHVPVHQEMYRDKCGGADRRSIVNWWKTPDTDPALIPGGFAESVFASAGDEEKKVEYAYLKDRKGFMRICLEEKKDIAPIYTFRVNWMYHNPPLLRGWRARFSQHYYIGLVPFTGWMGTAMPLHDTTHTVTFPPFEVTRYTPDELDECHDRYLDHLKYYFDKHKATYGMEGVELVFVGPDYEDEDWAANALRRMGVMSGTVTPQKQIVSKL